MLTSRPDQGGAYRLRTIATPQSWRQARPLQPVRAQSLEAPQQQHPITRASIAWLLALSYASFVVLFPWDLVTKVPFSDFDDTVIILDFYYSNGNPTAIDRYDVTNLTEFFVNEIIWHELIRQLTTVTGDSGSALHAVSFVILSVWGALIFRRVRPGLAILFLLNPLAIDIAMSAIRNGLAWSLVMVGMSLRWRYARALLFALAMFIHSATLALVIIYYATNFATARLPGAKSTIVAALALGMSVGLALSVFGESVLGVIGDRRAILDISGDTSPFLQASMWAILLFLQCSSGPQYVKKNAFVIAVLAWYLTMNLYIPWSFRVWSALLPVIAVAALELPHRHRTVFLYLYTCYLGAQYLYWTKLFYDWYPL